MKYSTRLTHLSALLTAAALACILSACASDSAGTAGLPAGASNVSAPTESSGGEDGAQGEEGQDAEKQGEEGQDAEGQGEEALDEGAQDGDALDEGGQSLGISELPEEGPCMWVSVP